VFSHYFFFLKTDLNSRTILEINQGTTKGITTITISILMISLVSSVMIPGYHAPKKLPHIPAPTRKYIPEIISNALALSGLVFNLRKPMISIIMAGLWHIK